MQPLPGQLLLFGDDAEVDPAPLMDRVPIEEPMTVPVVDTDLTLYIHDCGVVSDTVTVTWSEVRFERLAREGGRRPSGMVRYRCEGRPLAVRIPPGAILRDGRLSVPGCAWDATSVLYLAREGTRGFSLDHSSPDS